MLYVYLLVPETAGLTLEEVEDLFTGPWLQAMRRRQAVVTGINGAEVAGSGGSDLERREYVALYLRFQLNVTNKSASQDHG